MPNWSDNKIRIIGPTNDLQRFMTATAHTPTDENDSSNARLLVNLVPMPEELKDTHCPTPESPDPHPNWLKMYVNGEITKEWFDSLCESNRQNYAKAQEAIAKTGYASWWDWQINNWGVKWGDSETHLTMQGDEIVGTFMTPWGPPVEGLVNISKLFPTLSFKVSWTEEGGSYGHFLVAHGMVAESAEFNWDGELV